MDDNIKNTPIENTENKSQIQKVKVAKRKVPKSEKHPRKVLTHREELFCLLYAKTSNGSQSFLNAGYKVKHDPNTPEGKTELVSNSTRLLSKPSILEKIRSIRKDMYKTEIAEGEEVMAYLTAVMRGEIKDQFGLETPVSERTRAGLEIAKRTIDVDNRASGQADNTIKIQVDWKRE